MTDNKHIAALADLRVGVEMDRHNLPDSDAKLAALDAALAMLRAAGEPPTDKQILEIAANPICCPCSPWWLKDGVKIGDVQQGVLSFARALLARYAAPQASAEESAIDKPIPDSVEHYGLIDERVGAPAAEDSAKDAGDVALPRLPEHQFSHEDLGQLWDSTAMYLYALRYNVLDRLRRQQRGGDVGEHYDEVKATLQGAHRIMESISAVERRVGPVGSHARGYTHKITAALRHLDALAALAAHKPGGGGNPNLHHYGDVLQPFAQVMADELLANAGKGDRPGWLSCSADALMLEVYYHAAKLQKAVKDGNRDGIREYSADVANLAMMVLDVCGGIDAAISAQQDREGK